MIARLITRNSSARSILAGLAAFFLLGIAYPAPVNSQAQKPSADAVAIAKQIIDLKGAKRTIFDPLVRGVVERVKDQFMRTNFMWAKDLNEVAASLEKEYAARADKLVDASARIYASHFTEAELKQILAFYRSPLGQKVINEEPKTLDETMADAGRWGDRFSEEVIARMREEMKKRGHDI